jgi:hypothetical protein
MNHQKQTQTNPILPAYGETPVGMTRVSRGTKVLRKWGESGKIKREFYKNAYKVFLKGK